MPNSPTWILSFGFSGKVGGGELGGSDIPTLHDMSGSFAAVVPLFLCTPGMHVAGAVEIHAHPAEGVAEESVRGRLRALSIKTHAVCASDWIYWHVLKAEQGELKARFLRPCCLKYIVESIAWLDKLPWLDGARYIAVLQWM